MFYCLGVTVRCGCWRLGWSSALSDSAASFRYYSANLVLSLTIPQHKCLYKAKSHVGYTADPPSAQQDAFSHRTPAPLTKSRSSLMSLLKGVVTFVSGSRDRRYHPLIVSSNLIIDNPHGVDDRS